jgi:5'-phosphate synthase pdxT subunit
MLIGVLALQGGFAAHGRTLHALGAEVREVREPTDLEAIDGLVIPGGELTTMMLGIAREGLAEPLCALAAGGTPVLGTCAGMIMLDRSHLGLMDIDCRRNAFGRQVRSFEVQVLAELQGRPIAARQGSLLAVAFHPELGRDTRLHEAFLAEVRAATGALIEIARS